MRASMHFSQLRPKYALKWHVTRTVDIRYTALRATLEIDVMAEREQRGVPYFDLLLCDPPNFHNVNNRARLMVPFIL